VPDVETIEKTTVFEGYFRIDRHVLRHLRFDGGWTEPITREVFERGHAAAALLYDPDLDRLVLIEQFRIGVLAAADAPEVAETFSPWLIEIVAGIIDAGETPEGVVRREAQEEAGCTVDALEPACIMFASPGAASETIRIFCGCVDAAHAGGIHGLAEEHEDIRVLVVSSEEAFRRLDAGEVINATAMVALHWFRVNRARIRALWRSAEPAGAG
jgi:ADP-ribose pyrophosphatase